MNSRWFHRPEAARPGFHSWRSVQAKLLEVAGKAIHQAALVAIELAQTSWILPGSRVVLDDVIYGAVEDHKPGGITGYNLG